MRSFLGYLSIILGLGLLLSNNAWAPVRVDIKVGIMLGFTGPIESLTPAMADAAELAFKEASVSKELLDGRTITPIRTDSTCVNYL